MAGLLVNALGSAAATMGKAKAGALVEQALAEGGSFATALGPARVIT